AVLCGLAGAEQRAEQGAASAEGDPDGGLDGVGRRHLAGVDDPHLRHEQRAGVVNGAKSWFTVAFPEYWLFFLGALFIVVTLYLPRGLLGLLRKEKEQ
ncbi:urea ABC transporter permease subunit UrtC, partial [Pseudomonas aeruginosa]